MAIFYDYIKGINEDTTTITKIYFPQDNTSYPIIKLYSGNEYKTEKSLGEIITSGPEDGTPQIINNLKCKKLEIDDLVSKTITSTGDITIGTAAATDKPATGELIVNGTITASEIESDNVTLHNATIATEVTIDDTILTGGAIKFGAASLSATGILTVNQIKFIVETKPETSETPEV